MTFMDVKNYFFAYLFDFILFGVFATLMATIIFGSIYYYMHRTEVKSHLAGKKVFSPNISQPMPSLQRVSTDYKYYKNQ